MVSEQIRFEMTQIAPIDDILAVVVFFAIRIDVVGIILVAAFDD